MAVNDPLGFGTLHTAIALAASTQLTLPLFIKKRWKGSTKSAKQKKWQTNT